MAYHGFKPAEQAIQIGADEILSSHISDGVIVNADINSSAAIATSKISGALTSVAGSHGLATSATTDTTNASNISSGTLAAARVATLNQSTTGSAATLTTARNIGGVSFNGSAAINLPGVNASGNQNTSGQAGTVATIAGLAPNTATTQATQGAITSVGTLTSLTVSGAPFVISNINNGNNIDIKTTSGGSLVHAVKIHSGGLLEAKQGISSAGLTSIVTADVVTSGTQGSQLYIQDTADYNATQVSGIQFRQIWDSSGSITSTSGIYGARESTTSGQYGGALHFQTRVHGGDLADKMVIDSSGNVGIGTDSPATQMSAGTFLEIKKASGIAGLGLNGGGDSRWELTSDTGDDFKISRNGSTKLTLDGSSSNATFAGTVTIGGNTAIHAGNFTTYTGLWSQVDNTSGRRRTNYALGFQPNSNDYAGFEFFNQAGDGAGYLLVRANTDSGGLTYPANGIALVADTGHLNLVQRSSNSHGINLITNNGGSPIVALGLANNGNATFAGDVEVNGIVEADVFRTVTVYADTSTADTGEVSVSGQGMMFARNTSGNNAYYYTYAYFKSSGNSPTGLVEISSNAAGVASSAGTITFSTGTYGDSYIKAAHETGKGSLTMSIVRML